MKLVRLVRDVLAIALLGIMCGTPMLLVAVNR